MHLAFGPTDKFDVEINTPIGIKHFFLNGIKDFNIPIPGIMMASNKPKINFTTSEDFAVLTVNTFAKTDVKEGKQDFKGFIDKCFSQLKLKDIKNLIIDLRNNPGGTDANAVYLCSYLMNKPYRYWDRIEVTPAFALSIKGSAKLIYGKPVKQDSVYLWKKSRFTREFDFYKPQQPNKNAFRGNVFILMNGLCMSSCSDLIAILHHNKRAFFIGEETGGGYQCNNSGLMPKVALEHGLIATVPLLHYVNAVDPTINKGRGTMPDFAVTESIEDLLLSRDTEMEAAIKLLKANK